MITEPLNFALPPLVELVPNGKAPSRSHSTATWAQLIDRLRSLRDLEDDWDGQGALAPCAAFIDGAITLAQQFEANHSMPADFAIAGANGTVFLEWRLAAGFLEIEIAAPDHAEGRWVRNGSETTEVFSLPIRS